MFCYLRNYEMEQVFFLLDKNMASFRECCQKFRFRRNLETHLSGIYIFILRLKCVFLREAFTFVKFIFIKTIF